MLTQSYPNFQRQTATVTTTTGGTAQVDLTGLTGRVIEIHYVPDGTSPYAATVDFTITRLRGSVGLWTEADVTAEKVVTPTRLVQDQAGADSSERDFIYLQHDTIRIALAQGGSEKVGVFHIILG